MSGVVVNVIAIIIGTALGLLFGKAIHDRFRSIAFKAIGLSTFIIGASMSIGGLAKMGQTRMGDYAALVLVGSLIVGSLLGELIGVEYWLERFGVWLQDISYRIPWFNTTPSEASDEPGEKGHTLVEGFVTASLLFCVGAMTVLGSIQDGMGDHSTLYLKSLLDGFAALFLATTLGVGVGLSDHPGGHRAGRHRDVCALHPAVHDARRHLVAHVRGRCADPEHRPRSQRHQAPPGRQHASLDPGSDDRRRHPWLTSPSRPRSHMSPVVSPTPWSTFASPDTACTATA